MSRAMSAFSAAVFAVSAFGLTPTNAAAATPIPALDHVFMIVMENHSYPEIIGSGAAPYVNSLLTQSSVAANYVAVAHPSFPNYLALSGGSTFHIHPHLPTGLVSAANPGR